MKERLCQWGNCTIEHTGATVNCEGERPSFCGPVHAALWLLTKAGHRQLANDLEKQFSEK